MESWVRKYLQDKGYKDSDIGYDVNRKTVTLQGKDFVTPNRVTNGMSYASNADLDRAYNGFQNNSRQQEIQSQLANLKAKLNTPFQYNPSADPSYQAALNEAKAQAKVASKNAMETMNDRGILNSTVTSDRLGQIKQQSIANVENNILPQLMQQAYARDMDQRNALMNYMNTLNSQYQQGLDNQYRQDAFDYGKQQDARQFAVQESGITGKYLSSDASDKIQQLIALKAQAEASKNPGQFKPQGDALRAAIAGMGINANALFGSGVNAQQAQANLARAYTPTRQAVESDRNYNRGVLESDRNYNRGVLESDRNYNRGVLENDRSFNLQKANQSFDNNMALWDNLGVAPTGIPGVEPGTPLYDKVGARGNQMNKSELTSAIDQRILKAAQIHRENPGSEGLMGFIQNQIVPDLDELMSMGYNINDINSMIDRTVSAFTNGQFKTKNQYYQYLKEQMGEQQFNQWKKENDFTLNFPKQQKGVGIQTGSNSKTLQWAEPIQTAANKHGVPGQILFNMMVAESGGNPNARSHAGAIGLMQFMPGTAKGMGIDPSDPHQSIDGAARYLKGLYNQFGDWRLAVAAYNAGPGNVKKYKGIPPFKETQNYVKKVFA